MQERPQQPGAEPVRCTDLDATVFPTAVPDGVARELPSLYGSLFCTQEWFRIYDRVEASGACVLERPRHVLLFHVKIDTIEILNKAFPLPASDAARACKALFRAMPWVHRIHLEVLFAPRELRLPKSVLVWADDLVIELPSTVASYADSLGRRTRKNLRNYDNRLRSDWPQLATSIFRPAGQAHSRELVEQFLVWHLARCRALDIVSVYDSEPRQRRQLVELIAAAGEAQVTSVDGQPAAIEFLFQTGHEVTVYAGAFDRRYRDSHLGLLSTYWAVCESVRRKATRCHLLWSTAYYKSNLGANPVRAYRLSVFRSQAERLRYPREAWDTGRHRVTVTAPALYWGTRRRARTTVDRVTRHPEWTEALLRLRGRL